MDKKSSIYVWFIAVVLVLSSLSLANSFGLQVNPNRVYNHLYK